MTIPDAVHECTFTFKLKAWERVGNIQINLIDIFRTAKKAFYQSSRQLKKTCYLRKRLCIFEKDFVSRRPSIRITIFLFRGTMLQEKKEEEEYVTLENCLLQLTDPIRGIIDYNRIVWQSQRRDELI